MEAEKPVLYTFTAPLLSSEVLAKLMFNGFIAPEDATEMVDEMLLIIERAVARHRTPPEMLLGVQLELENTLAMFARPQD